MWPWFRLFFGLGRWLGFWMRGGDRAPLPGTAEAPTRLMPDSHNAVCESRPRGGLALDGFPAVRPMPAALGNGKISARAEPFVASDVLITKVTSIFGHDRR